MECTKLKASGLRSKVVRANKVTLENHCIIDQLYCDGEIILDDSCEIKKIVSSQEPIHKINQVFTVVTSEEMFPVVVELNVMIFMEM